MKNLRIPTAIDTALIHQLLADEWACFVQILDAFGTSKAKS